MSTQNISVSTELMKNYKQTALMSPEKKFEALQTCVGNSLLFSIGTDNVFYVTQESVGHETGWAKTDLSTAQIGQSFPAQSGLVVKTFEAAQSAVDGTIGIAMVVTDQAGNDHLFLCLGNSNADTSWTRKPGWVQYPFDNPTQNVNIVNVCLSETANQTQYIVVDILRDPSSAEKLISRYYINPAGKPAWQPHDVSIDLEAGSYTSCLGRQYLPNSPHQPTIDGLYTAGQVDGSAQIVFMPLYDVMNPSIPPSSVRLQLPVGVIANTIASSRKSDMSTDLYACGSDGGLYYFASGNQSDEATAALLFKSPLFNGVSKMYAHQTGSTVIVWGLNENDEMFYTACPAGQETASPSAWSYPLPIVTGVDLFSPYINCVDDGNTFFAVSDSTLQKLIKSPGNAIWKSQSITLPSPNSSDTQEYSSYTTRILVTNENNQPIANTPVAISGGSRTGVYINHLYYVLDSTGIQINTDSLGSVTIVEWVNGLTGTKLNVSAGDSAAQAINPMDKPFGKIAQMNTVSSLQNAVITNDDGSTQPLVSSSVSQSDLQAAATSNGQLGQVYNTLSPTGGGNSGAPTLRASSLAAKPTSLKVDSVDALLVDIGDLFRWLESGIEAVIQIVEDAASKVWHFVAKIGEQVYAAVLDAVEKVVAAAEWVFNQIKTAIEDLIKYVEFLFGWQDILTTHNVLKNFFIQLVNEAANNLSGYKTDIANAFQSLQDDVNKWANIPSFDQTVGGTTGSNQTTDAHNSAPSNLGIHHYQGNVQSSSSTYSPATFGKEIFNDLLNLLESEEATLTEALNAIKTDIIDQFDQLTVTEIIQKLVAVLADTLLQTAENIILTALDVFIQLIEGLLSVLTATIDIPVLSWLYKELTGNDLSFLDVICLIAAIPATIGYKLAVNTAPFPQGDSFTEGLLNATSFDQIKGSFYTSPPQTSSARGLMLMAADTPPVLDGNRLKVFAGISGFTAFAGSAVLVITTGIQRGLDYVNFNFIAKELAAIAAIANVAYVIPNVGGLINARTDNWYQQVNNGLTCVSIVKGFVNIGLTGLDSEGAGAKISPGIESVINLLWNAPVICNIIKYHDQAYTDYQALIPESIGNFCFNLGGMMELPIALSKDPVTKGVASLVQFGLMLLYGVCMPIAGGIFAFESSQKNW